METEGEKGKRLKRGLRDLSPLFQRAVPSPVAFEVQFLTVCVADHEGDSFLANAYVASQVVRQTSLFASLVSVASPLNGPTPRSPTLSPSPELLDSRIFRLPLSHQELWTLTQNGSSLKEGFPRTQAKEDFDPFLIFLDFEPSQFRSLARIALLLDRVVLFVQPQVESLREAYRLMKTFWSLNREIDFLLLFRGHLDAETQRGFFFERFSLITSRFLGISPDWLGELAFPDKDHPSLVSREGSSGLHLEPLLAAEGLRRPLPPEKFRFWSELRKILGTQYGNS